MTEFEIDSRRRVRAKGAAKVAERRRRIAAQGGPRRPRPMREIAW